MLDSPWDYLPLTFAKAGPVTIAAPQESPWNPADFVAAAQKANDLVRGLWGGVPASRGFLVFLADTKQAQEWFGPKADMSRSLGYAHFAAIATQDGTIKFIKPELGQPPKESRAGARIVVNMEQVKTPDAAYSVLAHEMTHAIGLHLMPRGLYVPDAAHKGSPLDTPFWVIEGFAAWVDSLTTPDGVQQTLNYVRSGWSKYHQSGDPGFPTNDAFFVEPAVHFNYEIGASFFAAVDRVAGRAKVVTAYVGLIQQSTLVANSRTLIDPVLAKLGIDAKKVWTTWHSMVGH
jgi:hypothetical protein